MGWLGSFMQQREIDRLERLLKTAPAPSIYVRLGELYEEKGDLERASSIAVEGSSRFPNNRELGEAKRQAARAHHAAEIERLRTRIEEYPNPTIYGKLAHLLLDADDQDECRAVCQRSLRAFPEYGGTYLVLAQLALREGARPEALEHLRKTVELDPCNYLAWMTLTEQLIRNGDDDEARACLQQVLTFAPGDSKAETMLADFVAVAEGIREEARQETPTKRLSLQELAQTAEDPDAAAPQELEQSLNSLLAVDGIEGCLLLDLHGLVVASRLPEVQDEELTAALMTNIFRASEQAAQVLGVGDVQEGILDSTAGRIYMLQVKEVLVGAFASPQAKAGRVQQAIHGFADRMNQAQ